MTLIINPEEGVGLIRSDSKGRMLVPVEQREAILEAFEPSDQSGGVFCRQHGLKYPTFATWVQKRNRRLGSRAKPPTRPQIPAFTEVMLDTPVPSLAHTSGGLAVTLPDGIRIDIICRSQLSWAAELLRHLSSSRPC